MAAVILTPVPDPALLTPLPSIIDPPGAFSVTAPLALIELTVILPLVALRLTLPDPLVAILAF